MSRMAGWCTHHGKKATETFLAAGCDMHIRGPHDGNYMDSLAKTSLMNRSSQAFGIRQMVGVLCSLA